MNAEQSQAIKSACAALFVDYARHVGADSLLEPPVSLRGAAAVGHYSNTFQLTTGGWRISSCHLQLAFRNPDHFPDLSSGTNQKHA